MRQLVDMEDQVFISGDLALSKWHSLAPMPRTGTTEELRQRIEARRQFWRDRLG
jgi:hypothetical protein